MDATKLSLNEMKGLCVGEPLTMATVILVFTVVILTVTAYKLFTSDQANFTLPNGFKFTWNQ